MPRIEFTHLKAHKRHEVQGTFSLNQEKLMNIGVADHFSSQNYMTEGPKAKTMAVQKDSLKNKNLPMKGHQGLQ